MSNFGNCPKNENPASALKALNLKLGTVVTPVVETFIANNCPLVIAAAETRVAVNHVLSFVFATTIVVLVCGPKVLFDGLPLPLTLSTKTPSVVPTVTVLVLI